MTDFLKAIFARRAALCALLILAVLGFGSAATLSAQTSVLTQHNDVGRTGLNPTETILTPANVNASLFGKLYSIPIDGQAYAQPLYMPSLAINGVNHSVLFVATEHDSVYAFDTNAQGATLWHASMAATAHGAASGATSDPLSTTGCVDVQGSEYGIKSTPVIDPTTNTLYTMSRTLENGSVVQRIHALDVTTGNEKFGGPVTIAASVSGTGTDAVTGLVTFNPTWQNQRPGLLLLNGTVYVGFGSVCDSSVWHGWILGYSAASGALEQTAVFNTTPNGEGSGIWMGGAGLAADTENGVSRIFPVTGNGTYDAAAPYGTNTMDYGDDILALTQTIGGGLKVTDEFTPDIQAALSNADEDQGSGGLLVLPDNLPGATYPHMALQVGKSGVLILVNRDNLGGYSTSVDDDLQEVRTSGDFGGLWGIPAYWNGNIYFWPASSSLQQYSLTNGALSTSPVAQGTPSEAGGGAGHEYDGTTVSVSSNGTRGPIVWGDDWVNYGGNPIQYFYAFDGTNVSNLLWSSTQNPVRDGAGAAQKWAVPTIADGKVYLASQGYIQVYGLLPPGFTMAAAQSAVSIPPTSSANIPITVSLYGGLSGPVTLSASGLPSGVTATFSNSNVLTLNVAANAPLTSGGATITITGTSGSVTQSLSILLNVASGPYGVPVSLASSYNVYAIQNNGTSPVHGGFDNEGFAYSETLIGSSVAYNGLVYSLAAAGAPDAVSSVTIPIAAAAGAVGPMNLLAAGANGNQVNQVFTLHYTDGTTSTFTQSLSDWGNGPQSANEATARSMAYRIAPGGADNTGPFYVYAYSVPLVPGEVLSSVALPANRNVILMALTMGTATSSTAQTITFNTVATQTVNTSINLTATATSGLAVYYSSSTTGVCTVSGTAAKMVAAGTCSITASQLGNNSYAAAAPVTQSFTVATSSTGSVPVNLSSYYNIYAIGTAGTSPLNGGFDGSGYAYNSAVLGATLSYGGITFTVGPANAADAVSSTTVALPAGSYSQLSLLGAAGFGPIASQSVVVTYSDKSTSTFTQSFSDWGYPQKYTGETTVSSMATRIIPGGTPQAGPWYVYGYTFALNPAKTVSSVTLPNSRNVVIVGIGLSGAGTAAQTISFNAVATQTVGTPLTLTATATSGLAVSYASSTTSICTMSGSVATFVASGTCSITASQAGNTTYAAATPVTQSFTVAGIAQTITFNSIATQTAGAALTLGARASSGLAVTYTSSTTTVCTVSGGTATMVTAGTCAITAAQAGNGSYAAAAPVSQSFTVATAASPTVAVNLSSVFNVYGIANNGTAPTNGGLDTASYAYSENLLGTSLTALGVPFSLGAAGSADAVSNATIPIPSGTFTSLNLLAAAVFGNQASQSFVLTYTDGTTSTYTQGVSDWGQPQNYPGENVGLSMAYRVAPNGTTQAGPWYVFAYSIPIPSGKTVKNLKLPASRNVVVTAVTMAGTNAKRAAQTTTSNRVATQ